jgi:hypothetical protein
VSLSRLAVNPSSEFWRMPNHVQHPHGCAGSSLVDADAFVDSDSFRERAHIANGTSRSRFDIDGTDHEIVVRTRPCFTVDRMASGAS